MKPGTSTSTEDKDSDNDSNSNSNSKSHYKDTGYTPSRSIHPSHQLTSPHFNSHSILVLFLSHSHYQSQSIPNHSQSFSIILDYSQSFSFHPQSPSILKKSPDSARPDVQYTNVTKTQAWALSRAIRSRKSREGNKTSTKSKQNLSHPSIHAAPAPIHKPSCVKLLDPRPANDPPASQPPNPPTPPTTHALCAREDEKPLKRLAGNACGLGYEYKCRTLDVVLTNRPPLREGKLPPRDRPIRRSSQ